MSKDIAQLTKESSVSSIKEIPTDEELTIRAVVSSNSVDREGDIVDNYSMRFNRTTDGEISIPVQLNHELDTKETIGNVTDVELDAQRGETIFTMRFMPFKRSAVETYLALAGGYLKNAFSIGFTYNPSLVEGNMFKEASVHEVSVTPIPANQDARVLMKSLDATTYKKVDLALKHIEDSETPEGESMSEVTEATNPVETVEVEEVQEPVLADSEKSESCEGSCSKPAEVTEEQQPAEEVAEEKEEKSMSENEIVAQVTKEVSDSLDSKFAAFLDTMKADKVEAEAKEVKTTEVVEEAAAAKEDHRVRTFKQIMAAKNHDMQTVARINKQNLAEWNTKDRVMNASDFGDLILCEQLFTDIYQCNEQFGVVANLVSRRQLTTSPTAKFLAKTGTMDFDLISNCMPKPAKAMSISAETAEVHEAAMSMVWCDVDAEDAVISWYDELVREIADAVRRLEDFIVLNWDGAKDGGAADPARATGLLVNPAVGRTTGVAAAQLSNGVLDGVVALADCARESATLVMNFAPHAKLVKGIGDNCCESQFDNENFGRAYMRIWGYRVVVSEAIPDNQILIGDFSQFFLLERGGLRVETSTSATIVLPDGSSVNTFQEDLTAGRAYRRIGGYTRNPNAFHIVECA